MDLCWWMSFWFFFSFFIDSFTICLEVFCLSSKDFTYFTVIIRNLKRIREAHILKSGLGFQSIFNFFQFNFQAFLNNFIRCNPLSTHSIPYFIRFSSFQPFQSNCHSISDHFQFFQFIFQSFGPFSMRFSPFQLISFHF